METDDPVIQRLRAPRAKFQAECDNDIHKMYERFVEMQKQHADRLVHWEHPDEILDFAPSEADKTKSQE